MAHEEGSEQGAARVTASFALTGLFPTYRHFHFLLGTARELADERPEAAIAVAQMAFESFVGFAMERLLRLNGVGSPLSERLTACVSTSLRPPSTRDLWRELTGRKIPKEDWQLYERHVARRNRVVHGGQRVKREDAERSIDAVRGLMAGMIKMAQEREQELKSQSQ